MKTYKLTILFALIMMGGLFLMSGCSSAPSADIAEKVLQDKIDSDSKGQIKLVSFKKTDGQKSEVNGIKCYELDCETEIEFQADGTWFKGAALDPIGYGFSTQQPEQNFFGALLNQTVNGGIKVGRGDRVKIVDVMQGEQKESGWVFVVGDSHIISGPTANHSFSEKTEKSEQAQAANTSQQIKDLKQSIKNGGNGEGFAPVPVPIKNALNRIIAWRYINQDGSFAISSQYALAEYFSNGLAAVRLFPDTDDLTKKPIKGFIDVTGKLVLIEKTSNGIVRFFYTSGQKAVTPQSAENSLKQICIKNLMSIEIAKDLWDAEVNKGKGGNPSVSDLLPYLNNSFPICPDGGIYTINPVGQRPVCSIPSHVAKNSNIKTSDAFLLEKDFFLVKDFSEELAPAIKTDGRFCFINTNGEIVLKTTAIDAFPFSEGFARIQTENGYWGFINKKGETAIAPQFIYADSFHDGLAKVVSVVDQTEYIDGKGNVIYSPDDQRIDGLKQKVESSGDDWENYKQEAKLIYEANTCINNLRQIDSAKNQWALQNGKYSTAIPTWDDIKPYLKNGEIPQCPSGGIYILNSVAQNPTCSIPKHQM